MEELTWCGSFTGCSLTLAMLFLSSNRMARDEKTATPLAGWCYGVRTVCLALVLDMYDNSKKSAWAQGTRQLPTSTALQAGAHSLLTVKMCSAKRITIKQSAKASILVILQKYVRALESKIPLVYFSIYWRGLHATIDFLQKEWLSHLNTLEILAKCCLPQRYLPKIRHVLMQIADVPARWSQLVQLLS